MESSDNKEGVPLPPARFGLMPALPAPGSFPGLGAGLRGTGVGTVRRSLGASMPSIEELEAKTVTTYMRELDTCR
jgi:hypothetical protein